MARKRRPFEVFSMSFLDCMSCGFGAVILFFMIINAQVKETTEDDPSDLMAETRMLEVEILEGRKNLRSERGRVEHERLHDFAEPAVACAELDKTFGVSLRVFLDLLEGSVELFPKE